MAKLSGIPDDGFREYPCYVCGAPPRGGTSVQELRPYLPDATEGTKHPGPRFLQHVIGGIASDSWVKEASSLLRLHQLCHWCRKPLEVALSSDQQARELAAQAIEFDPANEAASDLLKQRGQPELVPPFRAIRSRSLNKGIEPELSEADIDQGKRLPE